MKKEYYESSIDYKTFNNHNKRMKHLKHNNDQQAIPTIDKNAYS